MPSPLDHADKFILLDSKTEQSSMGPDKTWDEDIEFQCLLSTNSSYEGISAEQQVVLSAYTCIVEKDLPIEFQMVFKRVFDGASFRVVSDPKDSEIPNMASFQVKSFMAVRYVIPEVADD